MLVFSSAVSFASISSRIGAMNMRSMTGESASAKTIYGLPCLLSLYGLPWLRPRFLDICKYDFWLTLLTQLISYFPLRSSLLHPGSVHYPI